MKTKLILPLAKLLLAAAAVTLAACSGPGYPTNRVVDPFPNHCYPHNHCDHNSNHCAH